MSEIRGATDQAITQNSGLDLRLHLRPVERHVPELHQPSLPAELQHLHEESGQRLEVDPAKLRNRRVVRMVPRRDHPERDVVVRLALDLSRRCDSAAVTVEQQRRHHLRMVRRIPAQLLLVVPLDICQIKFAHHVHHEVREVPFRQPVSRRRRKEQALLRLVRLERLCHPPT